MKNYADGRTSRGPGDATGRDARRGLGTRLMRTRVERGIGGEGIRLVGHGRIDHLQHEDALTRVRSERDEWRNPWITAQIGKRFAGATLEDIRVEATLGVRRLRNLEIGPQRPGENRDRNRDQHRARCRWPERFLRGPLRGFVAGPGKPPAV